MTSKKIFGLLAALAIVQMGCDEPQNDSSLIEAELGETAQAVINGTEDRGDPAVVGLYKVSSKTQNDNGSYSYSGSIYCTVRLSTPSGY